MHNRRLSVFSRIIVCFLIVVVTLPIRTYASSELEVPTRASYYLSAYGSYIHLEEGGKIQVYFYVEGTRLMDELGSLSIQIYECTTNSTDSDDWIWKETFKHSSTPGMLSYNDDYHSGHIDYNGVVGRWYKAYVCIWGGKDGGGDTRYFWTVPRQASLQGD